jgi:polyisoprenyl-phosphate glycosyltransferase
MICGRQREIASSSAFTMSNMVEQANTSRSLSVVVPCYNEESVIPEFYHRVTNVCRKTLGDDYELVLVNDGSQDSTWPMLQNLAKKDPRVVAIDLSRNHGHQLALSAGLSLARGARILVLDCDLQDPPELLPDMMRAMDKGADVVFGQRTEREGEGWFKKIAAMAFYRLLLRLTDVPIPPDTGDFRLMSRRVVDALLEMPEYHRFIRGMVAWIGFRQVPIHYRREPRFAGRTKYPLGKMLNLATDAITGFSVLPLRFSFYLAIVFLLIAAALGIHAFWAWLFLDLTRGWTSLFLGMLVFSSVQLISLAIIGEYLGRVYMQTKRRPLFLIREIVVASSAPEEQDPR